MLTKLLLATTLLLGVACQGKGDARRMPRLPLLLIRDRANPVMIVGNQAALSRLLQAR